MTETGFFSAGDLRDLACRVLMAHDTSAGNAASVAAALVAAEVDGQKGHGLSRLAAYSAQAASGKVQGHAVPLAEPAGTAAIRIDAKAGFAFPAMDLAIEKLAGMAPECGIAMAGVFHSHHFGQSGYHAERLARRGLIGLILGNSPKAIAPWGGRDGVFGTNPIAFAAPRRAAEPLLIDLSLSKVARGKVMVAAKNGTPIPEDWALDKDGQPTTDAKAALEGTMIPIGDAKGAALVLMVEVLAAAVTGANFGFEASSFFTADGPPPGVGQSLIAIDPNRLSGGAFAERLEVLLNAIVAQPGTRLPGMRRLSMREKARKEGIAVDHGFIEELEQLARK
ncbi:Ldh family oxidoreductase [Denitrobaculum tricleocarpae]|uniref:Ldh family oxidoreductase n=1 Tax=Denitrobaculum tricleocarpae TaxID=2591009 RepID=A0A545TXE8_9PROT|nr:Ldh family oxidoreductase [Denitrobaculum tricleocarpae]TQV81870.1 Ldh family oxidoreductase [Denitrobaculum tricleocarpae]